MSFSISEPARGVCETCGSETELVENHCHLCTRLRAKEKNVRVGGAILAVLGLIVMVMMSFVISAVQRASSGSNWSRSAQSTDVVLSILYFVSAYGVIGLIAGLWHFVTGRVNKILLYSLFAAGIVLGLGARFIAAGK